MKRIILALFAGFGLVAVPASADEKAPATATTTATPVVVTESATPARRGILARLRDRRATSTMTPATTGTVVTPSTTTPPAPVPAPMPMPGVKPASGTTTTTGGVVTAGYTTSTPTRTGLFSRIRNRGTTGTTGTTTTTPAPMPMSAVLPASGTVTMEPMVEPTTTTRMGLIARLRARR